MLTMADAENAPYEFQYNVGAGTYLFLEVWCQQNYGQACEYTIDVLGSITSDFSFTSLLG